ncbi:MAG TPA: acetyl-CoA C-acyltransferase [Gammaproteobacteria bacterium]|nr:acetyl-CoA C-acyltransferase [Gammaproteobacteria bacterium]
MQQDPIIIGALARTPQGSLLGELKDFTAIQLGSHVIKSIIERSSLSIESIGEVIMGCVLPAGLGQAPARQAALSAGLLNETGCTTINKMCGSGMKAVTFAYDALLAGQQKAFIAGGMESMSNAPYILSKARQGYRLGHGQLVDHMMLDGLEDAYDKGRPMGYFADECARQYGFSREAQDRFAISSFERARKAIIKGYFTKEISPIIYPSKQDRKIIADDERPNSVAIEKISQLHPAFIKGGTVTAGNSSAISDGAAALLLMRLSQAEENGIVPLARIVGHSAFAKAPDQFTTAPIDAIRLLLEKINWDISQVDLFEINEAFAVVAMVTMQALKIPHEKINIHGGGCALGHPIGATGARIITTLTSALLQYGLKRGIASLCIGGGEATAIAIEII